VIEPPDVSVWVIETKVLSKVTLVALVYVIVKETSVVEFAIKVDGAPIVTVGT
jgi:hypothetical protein